MKALISDIHGNYEALKAVFEDIDAHHADEVYFLGDVVGYGPEPEACIDLIEQRCSVFLMGNHDHAILNEPVRFNPIAEQAIRCLKTRMKPGIYSRKKRHRWKFLRNLKTEHMENGIMFVHASPREPVSEYILPSDPLYYPDKIKDIFDRIEHLAFCGHTHVPGVITEEPSFISPSELDYIYKITDKKVIVNIGSVGQPRDRNPDACYVLLYEDRIVWRRVPYSIENTIRKINEIECLHPRNGERLLEGK